MVYQQSVLLEHIIWMKLFIRTPDFSEKLLLRKSGIMFMASKNENAKSHFQKKFLPAGIISLILFLCLCQPVLPISHESTNSTMTSNLDQVTSMTLKVSSTFPQDGAVLTNFPANLEIKVTRGGFPVQGDRVQFWMMGGSHDAEMHNAFLTTTDSAGYARLTLLNQNTLDPGPYIWYADAMQPGFRAGASKVISFTNPFASSNGISASGGTVSTDQKKYFIAPDNGASVVIYGNVNNYHLGQPIILKIKAPSGKTVQMVEYGSYLGAFQGVYNLGQNSELGPYMMTVFHNYVVSSTSKFDVVK